ncbi:MAG: PBP1A family penicillin-binding protein [Parvibaculum sp.]
MGDPVDLLANWMQMARGQQNRRRKRGAGPNRSQIERRIPFFGTVRVEVERPEKAAPRTSRNAAKPVIPTRSTPARATARRDDQTPGRRLAYWGAVTGLWAMIALGGFVLYYAMSLPSTEGLWDIDMSSGVTLVAVDGSPAVVRGQGQGMSVPLSDLPPYLINAVLATEDQRFFSHPGIDIFGLGRAMLANLKAGAVVQGGSTLTQQLAKNIFLTPERTLDRKIQEAILALWLEAKFTKEEILTLYLNRVYLGGGAYGVEAASQRYFGKSARDVTLAEAAMLAGLLKAPSRYAPTNDLARSHERAATVLASMVRENFISHADGQNAYDNPARLAGAARSQSINYFADWVMDLVPGFAGRPSASLLVRTTLDPALQTAAERVVEDAIAKNRSTLGVSQAAIVVMTPDGAIRAMVGGASYRQSQYNRAAYAERQPGSAFKPFVYMAAMEQGLRPETLRVDAPITVDGWSPRNYTEKFNGIMSLTDALSRSINTVAVQISEEVGRENVIRTARRLGFQSHMQPHASIALGTFEVTLLELTSAYAAFANGGSSVIPHGIESVTTATGDRLYERRGTGVGRIMSGETVGMMNYMLGETMRNGTGRRAALEGRPAAGKTGTSQDFRDAWFVGYTSDLVVGIWVGNDDGTPMKRVTGGGLPADMWHDFMMRTQSDQVVSALPGHYQPYDVATSSIQRTDDLLATEREPVYQAPDRRHEEPEQGTGFFANLFGLSGSASGRDIESMQRPGRNSWR